MSFELSDRLQKLPPYLFAQIDKAKRKALSEGRDIINLGIGDPDTPTPRFIIDALNKALLEDASTHRYALDAGLPLFKEKIAAWYKKRFGVKLDPITEILPLIGSKEGIAHLPLGFINNGDVVLCPDPCYPPYKNGTIFAGGEPVIMPLKEENDFLPDLDAIDKAALKRAKIMFLNYPNNPTAGVADKAFYAKAIEFAKEHKIFIAHDAAYSEVSYDGYVAPSFLEMPGAKEIGLEFHSLSKTCNMTGWRVGWAAGNADLITGLAKVKSNIDSGIFTAIQHAGCAAIDNSAEVSKELIKIYQARRDVLVKGLQDIGWKVNAPKATFYVWVRTPDGSGSIEAAGRMLDKANIVVTPGVGFGPSGEGYIRFALTVPEDRLKEAVSRIKKL